MTTTVADLTRDDLDLIVAALELRVNACREYQYYPDAAFRQAQIDSVRAVLVKARAMRKAAQP